MDGTLIFEPEERGSKVVIRRIAPHYTGSGDVIARRVELTDAQAIVKAVNCHDDLVAALGEAAKVLAQPEVYSIWPVAALRMSIDELLTKAEAA